VFLGDGGTAQLRDSELMSPSVSAAASEGGKSAQRRDATIDHIPAATGYYRRGEWWMMFLQESPTLLEP